VALVNHVGATSHTEGSMIREDDGEGKRIAFVEPTFKYAAYQNGSFYDFFAKYSPKIQFNPNMTVTTDLNLLKDRPVPHEPFFYFNDPTYYTVPYKEYFDLLFDISKENNLTIANLTDADVHDGKIFGRDGKNAYDVLFLFHNEYVTQSEYDNFKRFVSNGGTIVFTEANTFFAEVSYNRTSDTITLVDGHYWKFDGKTAKPSVGERWLNESKEWMGSNYLDVTDRVLFGNNPFNYPHVEEQYVTNPNAKIIHDFEAFNISKPFSNATVAMYMMNHDKGKVINLGIWGHLLLNNTDFIDYFDNVILPLALNQSFYSNMFDAAQNATVIEPIPTPVNNCADYDAITNTILVVCHASLSQISQAIENTSALGKGPNGVWTLNAILYVGPNATIEMDDKDTSWLKISNKNNESSNFISIAGSAKIDGVKITSWDAKSNGTIHQNTNGSFSRPFIKVENAEGTANISDSEIAFLGNKSYSSNGLAYLQGGNGSSITNSTIHDMGEDGVYADSAENLLLKNNTVNNNPRHGINADSGSHNISIIGNNVHNNGESGILCSDACHNTTLDGNTVHNNGVSGLMFSGGTFNNTAKGNYAVDEKTGILIRSSNSNQIYNNLLKSDDTGIVIETSVDNRIYNNTMSNNQVGILNDDQNQNNVLENNTINNVSSSNPVLDKSHENNSNDIMTIISNIFS
jgi:parallel beta-helix repeat protein